MNGSAITPGRIAGLVGARVAACRFVASDYALHICIQVLIWAFIYTAWSIMGRFGLTSFGHGAFLGLGAYIPALLWNYFGADAVARHPARRCAAVLLALVIGYPSFRLRVVGHYFALVTLALSQVVLLTLIAARDITGGSLGMTPERRRPFLVGAAIHRQDYFYSSPSCCGWAASRSGAGSMAASAASRSRRSPRTRRPPPRCGINVHARETAGHGASAPR